MGTEQKLELGGPEEKLMVNAPKEEKLLGNESEKLGEQQQKIKELEEKMLRLQAEFENYKKRVVRENEMIGEKYNADAMMKLIPVVDELELAIEHMEKSPHKEFKHGIELIYAKLRDLLKKDGVVEMKVLGEVFDPFKHDALRQAEGHEGKVIEVIQKGYYINGKILRHAKVVVGKGK